MSALDRWLKPQAQGRVGAVADALSDALYQAFKLETGHSLTDRAAAMVEAAELAEHFASLARAYAEKQSGR